MITWHPQANAVFLDAREFTAGPSREEFLDRACGDDRVLRDRVVSLLHADAQAIGFLESPVDGQSVTVDATSLERTGEHVGPYKLLQEIGEGGMGRVFMAEQTHPVRRTVAFKIIKPGMDSRQVVARFEAERQALALMDHPNIAKVLDAGMTNAGRPYFVMELVKGIAINQYCDQLKSTVRERMQIFVPVCYAVQHAHQKGIIHRDLKPSNVMIALYDGVPVPKVIDFGVAKAVGFKLTERTLFTEFGAIVGTLEYMSPEQAELNQLDVDTRSDIYSLGALLYELITGAMPLDRSRLKKSSLLDALRMIREEEPVRPSTRISTNENTATIAANRKTEPVKLKGTVKGELDWIVMKALEKDRRRRYQTAGELARDINCYLNGEPVSACSPSTLYRIRKFTQRHKGAVLTVAIITASLVIATIISTWQSIVARHAENLAQQRLIAVEESRSRERDALSRERLARDAAMRLAREERLRAAQERFEAAGRYFDRNEIAASLLTYTRVLSLIESILPGDTRQLADQMPAAAALAQSARLQIGATAISPVVPAATIRHFGAVESVCFSPDGDLLVTACKDGKARIWNVTTGQMVGDAMEHAGWVNVAQFLPDGSQIATASQDGWCRFWNGRSGKQENNPLQLSGPISSLCIRPTASEIIATAEWWGTVSLWNVSEGKMIGSPLVTGRTIIRRICFSPDGTQLAVAFWNGRVQLWDVDERKEVGEPLQHGGPVSDMCFSRDGCWLATAAADRNARLWDLRDKKPKAKTLPHDSLVASIAFSPDGKVVATGTESQLVQFWDTESGVQLPTLLRHDGLVGSVCFSADGSMLATGSEDHTARIWDIRGLRSTARTISLHSRVLCVRFSADGSRLAAGCEDSTARLWKVSNLQPVGQPLPHSASVESVCLSPDDTMLATGSANGTVQIWDAKSGTRLGEPLQHKAKVNCVAFNPHGKTLATASDEYSARIWDLDSRQPIGSAMTHQGMISCVVFSPDGRQIATASEDQTVQLWNADDGTPLGERFQLHGWASAVAFNHDGTKLATGSWAHDVLIWDLKTKRQLGRVLRQAQKISSVAFSPNGEILATGCWDGIVCLWDVSSGTRLGGPLHHSREVTSLDFSSDGKTLLTSSMDGVIRLWTVPTSATWALDDLTQWCETLAAARLSDAGIFEPLTFEQATKKDGAHRQFGGPPLDWINVRKSFFRNKLIPR